MVILFLYCYFGVLASESFEQMGETLYESNWPNLPISLQKYFAIMIANMQRPLYYDGFGVANLDLKTFIIVSSSNEQSFAL